MSTDLPPIEARVSAQERLQVILHARIEELAQDMDASFQQLVAYQIGFEQKVDARFDKVEADIVEVRADIAEVKTDIAGIKTDVAEVKSGIATMESRILNAFQQLVTMIDTRLPAQGEQ